MQFFRRHRTSVIVLLVLGLGVSAYILTKEKDTPAWVTGTVTRGVVRELVSVSGVIEANSEATLSFPANGIVREIFVREGDTVVENQALATLEQSELSAERQDAQASLLIAIADRDELLSGPRSEAREVTESAVSIARADLARTTSEEARKVTNAYRTLLSDDLEALPVDPETEALAPRISGTYTCSDEGEYRIDTFRSGAQSGYSYRLSGLESGTFTAYTDSPTPLGACGLRIQFIEGQLYGNRSWTVTLPNTHSTAYVGNMNAFLLAKEQEKNAKQAAEEVLEKALREQTLANALPREEALARADALVLQAESRLAQIDARLGERTLRAPFDGVVSDISLSSGEVSGSDTISLIAPNVFKLTVRIPEIDITKIAVGDSADTRFDARPEEIIKARIDFISPVATEIDGVAYFEATLVFDQPPIWMRSGLNADVDIIVDERKNVLHLPKRFVVREGDAAYVLFPLGTEMRREPVTVEFTGNDGFVAIKGNVKEGDTVIAP